MSFQSAAGRQRGRLAVATAISLVLLLIEVVVGLAANSLALLADAGHLFADVSGMVISLRTRPALTPRSDQPHQHVARHGPPARTRLGPRFAITIAD